MFSFISCQKKQLNQVVFLKKNQDVGLYREPEYLKKVQLKLGDLQVNEIHEKLNFRDELLINASISVFEKGKLIRTINKSKFLIEVKKGDLIHLDSLSFPEVEVKKNQLLGVQISVWEVDDYSKINEKVTQINQVVTLVQVPITLMEWSSVSNPLGWFMWGVRVGGFGLNWLSKNDRNDLIGVSEIQWKENDMPKFNFTRSKKDIFVNLKKGLTNFNYVLNYQIISKEVIR